MPGSLHRYTLGQVARPVGIVSACKGGEISEKLARDGLDDRAGEPASGTWMKSSNTSIVSTADADDVCTSASQLGRT